MTIALMSLGDVLSALWVSFWIAAPLALSLYVFRRAIRGGLQ